MLLHPGEKVVSIYSGEIATIMVIYMNYTLWSEIRCIIKKYQ